MFSPGDRVLLHRPYTAHKLASHWSGPHTIVRRLADYLVRDYFMGSEHAMHVSRLQRFNMSRTTEDQIAAMNVDEGWFIPASVLGHRVRDPDGVLELQIRWAALDQEEDSWELATNVEHVSLVADYMRGHGLQSGRVPAASGRSRRRG